MESPGEASASTDVVDHESQDPSVPSSPPPRSPGIFHEINGATSDDRNGESSPVPPPHGIKPTSPPPMTWSQPPQQQPSIDPEACKSLGNKYFIAKDFKKAIKEYTKGRAGV